MGAFLFGWNPIKWPWIELPHDIERLNKEGSITEDWSIAAYKAAKPGDRAYFVRVAVEPKGIFASGTLASEPFIAFRKGRHYHRVNINIDTLLNPDTGRILTFDILKTGNLAGQLWTPQASGINIKPHLVDELEGLWQDFLENRHTADDIV
ncbi:hypothetical protein [Mucilaginibacter ginkgonis]|uniref:Uncharacterized protein n=1 Tax=Mucilaginibacter ginkgonis TaxID=2682091 RepID=A0A6I4I5S1_9SPHI|nr:hypothetical protein [Mucilaginibacter ginkgonis]QQL48541.1 hypothetical protein GO620_010090 [Mucilaginibacter ginkgonis]